MITKHWAHSIREVILRARADADRHEEHAGGMHVIGAWKAGLSTKEIILRAETYEIAYNAHLANRMKEMNEFELTAFNEKTRWNKLTTEQQARERLQNQVNILTAELKTKETQSKHFFQL
jgi:hypothetical protein